MLLDTYDTVAAAHKAVTVGREMEGRGERLSGIRLGSGTWRSSPRRSGRSSNGRIVEPLPALATIRSCCAAEVAGLPHDVRALNHPERYPVRYSAALMAHQRALEAAVRATEITRG